MATTNKRKTTGKGGKGTRKSRKNEVQAPLPQEEGFLYAEAMIILSFALAVLLFLSNFHLCGIAGDFLRGVQLGLFGSMGFLAPLLLFVGTTFYMSNQGNPAAIRKLVASVVAFLMLCGFLQQFFGAKPIDGTKFLEYYELSSAEGRGGGLVGGLIYGGLSSVMGGIGAFLVEVVCFLISAVCITERSLVKAVKTRSDAAYQYAREDMDRRKEQHARRQEEQRRLREEQRVRGVNLNSADLSASAYPDGEWMEETGGMYEDDYIDDDYIEDDYAGNDYAENDYVEDDLAEGDEPEFQRTDKKGSGQPDSKTGKRRSARQEKEAGGRKSARTEPEKESGPGPADIFTGTISPSMEYDDEEEDTAPFYEEPEDLAASAQRLVASGIGSYMDSGQGWQDGADRMAPVSRFLDDVEGEDDGFRIPVTPGNRRMEPVEMKDSGPEIPIRMGGRSPRQETEALGQNQESGSVRPGMETDGTGRSREQGSFRQTGSAESSRSQGMGLPYRTAEPAGSDRSREELWSEDEDDSGDILDISAYMPESVRPGRGMAVGVDAYMPEPADAGRSQSAGMTGAGAGRTEASGVSGSPSAGIASCMPQKAQAAPSGSISVVEDDSGFYDGEQPYTRGQSYNGEQPYTRGQSYDRGQSYKGQTYTRASSYDADLPDDDPFDTGQPDYMAGDGTFSIPEEPKRVVTATGKVIETDTEMLKKRIERKRQETAADEDGEASVQQQIQEKQEEPRKEYIFPSLDLLKKGPRNAGGHSDKEYRETAIKLQQTLRDFGVGVTVTNISCGPSVTRYELHPEQGVKVSRIVGLTDDIKLSLAAEDIRIEAPIPGKSAVGIEVPNKENTTVYLRDLLEADSFQQNSSSLAFAVGKDIGGQPVVTDIAKMPHLLIAGATGSGKSVCINTLIMSIIFKASPDDVKLIMVDPKVVELSVYNGIPHLLIPVVTDPKKASGALNWAVAEMMDRYKKFAEYNVRNIKGYNARVEALGDIHDPDKPKKLPLIVIIVDELADLMMVAAGEVEDAICRLAQLARAAGIHLVIATQRPSVNVITGLIKANVPSRVAFAVSSGVDSRTIIDMNGAEKLLGKGDMLFYPAGYPKPQRVQGAFVSDSEVQAVVDFLTEQGLTASYSPDIERQMSVAPAAAQPEAGDGRDEYFCQAGKFIIEKEKASIGMLQRMFKIGFNRAARIMDQLSEAGVVGPEEGTKPRRILMTMEEFEAMMEEQ